MLWTEGVGVPEVGLPARPAPGTIHGVTGRTRNCSPRAQHVCTRGSNAPCLLLGTWCVGWTDAGQLVGAGWGESTGQGEREAVGPALQGQWTALDSTGRHWMALDSGRGIQQAVGHAGLRLRCRVGGKAEQRGCAPVSALP